jgi:hypothetical protein
MRRTRNAAAISLVYTPPPRRNQGYAGAAVAALVEHKEGRRPASTPISETQSTIAAMPRAVSAPPRYLEKYAIAKGKTLSAVLRVLTKGTCSPYIIDFPTIDLADYFETISRAPGSPG